MDCGLCMAKLSSLNGEYGYIFLRNTEQKERAKAMGNFNKLSGTLNIMVKSSKLLGVVVRVCTIQQQYKYS